jgi:predicted nucleic acid-binding protein
MCEQRYGAAVTTSSTNNNCRRRKRRLALVLSVNKSERAEELLRSDHHLVAPDRALAIAIELRHPVYDCFYLALAERNTSPLVTADERLIHRCAGTPFEKLARPL